MILISYDLNSPGQNYQALIGAIQRLGEARKCLYSAWAVKTNLTPPQVSERLKPYMDQNDSLLVVDFNPVTADGWLDKELWGWIKSPSLNLYR